MSQTKETIRYIFTSRKQIFSFLFVVLFYPHFHQMLTVNIDNAKEFASTTIFIYLISLVFSSLVFGGVSELKKNYVWKINSVYRRHLLSCILIIASVFSLLYALIYSTDVVRFLMYFLIAFGVFSCNCFKKDDEEIPLIFLVFCLPVYFLFFDKLSLHQNTIMLLIFIHAIGLVCLGFWNYKKTIAISSVVEDDYDAEDDNTLCNGELNYNVGQLFKAVISLNKTGIDLLINPPLMKYGITGALFVAPVLILVMFSEVNHIEAFAIIIMIGMFWTIIFTSRKLMLQTLKVSHLYVGANHRQLKNKILLAVDKTLVLNCLVYFGICGLAFIAIGLTINTGFLLLLTSVIILLWFAYYPIIIVFDEIPVLRMLPPLLFLIISVSLVFGASQDKSESLPVGFLAVFIIFCLILRWFSQNLFLKNPYEKLIKNNY